MRRKKRRRRRMRDSFQKLIKGRKEMEHKYTV